MSTREINKIQTKAAKLAKDRLDVMEQLRQFADKNAKLRKQINEVDPNFLSKLYYWPGDITAHRIANVLNKIS